MTAELKARVSVDALLVETGWFMCSVADTNLPLARAPRSSPQAKAFFGGSTKT